MKATLLHYGATAIAAMALGFTGCVHITNTYTGYPGQNGSQSAPGTVAANTSGRADCGCNGSARASYPQGYAPNPYAPNGGYYPPPYYSSGPQIYNEYPYSYYPYPQTVYVPYDGGGSTGSSGTPTGGNSGQTSNGPMVGGTGSQPVDAGTPPRGYESHVRGPAQSQPSGPAPIYSNGPEQHAGSGIDRSGPATRDERPRADAPQVDGQPRSNVHPAVVTGPSPNVSADPTARASTPRVDRQPVSGHESEVRPILPYGAGSGDQRANTGAAQDVAPAPDVAATPQVPATPKHPEPVISQPHGNVDAAAPAMNPSNAQPVESHSRRTVPSVPATEPAAAPAAAQPASAATGTAARAATPAAAGAQSTTPATTASPGATASPAGVSSTVRRQNRGADSTAPAAAAPAAAVPAERVTPAAPAQTAGSVVPTRPTTDTVPATPTAGSPR